MKTTSTIFNSIPHQETARILWNRSLGLHYGLMGLACGSHYQTARPGQFITLRLAHETSPLLRRPFSIHRLIQENGHVSGIEILYKIVGSFTDKLSRVPMDAAVDLLGPLGRGFSVDPARKKVLLIAGGIGVAPLMFLADRLARNGADMSESAVCIGGRTANDILCRTDFLLHGMNVFIATEDGGLGEQGLVLQPAAHVIKAGLPDIIYACGPMPMLKAVIALAKLHGIPCEVSIETMMACGLAACLGCAVKTSDSGDGYRHVCKDGPVFDASRLMLS
jgi:dihydroorotate dehydrogenase electron transfer subunit